MEQRPLRLGDIVDDYCPRERRITNHAVVALIGDDIRQTRCTTCDVEHVYKQARVPKRVASKDGADSAVDNGSGQLVPRAAAGKDEAHPASNGSPSERPDPPAADPPADRPVENGDLPRDVDGWLAHRPLIRATLPRTEGEPPAPRPIPEFTMHRQAYGRPFRGHGRHGHSGASNGFDHDRQGNGNDNRGNHGNHGNFGNGSPGNGQPRPAGGGRRRRRRGGRHKQSH
jgi:hypothetical protein